MSEGTQRRLAAIVSADVVGYSRLMGRDEAGTLQRLKAHRSELIDLLIAKHGGRIVKTTGDGLLLEFPSVVAAVECCVAVQEGMAERNNDAGEDAIRFRVGVHLGDVIVEGDDIFGDGVNVAARLQEIGDAGGVTISSNAHDSVDGRLEARFVDAGDQELKNIARPVRVWRWRPDRQTPEGAVAAGSDEPLPLPDKPSIAVLPFDNLSRNPEQEFFADGIVEDLITALSRFPWLFVIARNSTFSYKGQNTPIKQVAKDLGVRYVVEGSIRSSSTRLRVTVQLIDAVSGHHVWAENYDRPTGDLFDLQDEITQSITGVLVPALSVAERGRSLRDNRPKLDAWQVFQKGLAHFYRPYNDVDHAEARRLFDRSIELDRNFADAHAMVALMGAYAINSGQSSYTATTAEILDEARRSSRLAVQCEDNNALSHLVMGRVYGLDGDFEAAVAECETAVRLNPNFAMAYHEMGFVLVYAGHYEEAISCFDRAIRLSPNDPARWNFYLLKGSASYMTGKFDDAIICSKEAARLRPTAFWPFLILTVALSASDRLEEARSALTVLLRLKPDFGVAYYTEHLKQFKSEPAHLRKMFEELLKVGLPD